MARLQIFNKQTYENVNKESIMILEDYILEMKSKKKSKGTIYQYTADIKMFYCWVHDNLNNKSILDIKKREFRNFFLFLEEKSPARINRVQCSIRNLLEFCTQDDEEYDEYDINIMRNIKGLTREKVRKIEFLSDEQVNVIVNKLLEAEDYQKALYLTLSYESAARRNEVHQVLKEGFLESNKTNEVVGKRGKQFPLIYFSKTKEIAEKYFNERGEDDIESLWVVGSGEKKRAASYETLYNWTMKFRDILETETGEKIDFNPHSYRHSALENYSDGTHYVLQEMGIEKLDINMLKVLANHEDISTTESYLKDKGQEKLFNLFGI